MPETKIIKDNPAAVLRALANGHRVRFREWTCAFLEMSPDGRLRDENGTLMNLALTGTCNVLLKRDMGRDPKPGDVARHADTKIVVDAVTEKGVMFEWPEGGMESVRRRTWTESFTSGLIAPVEYADA